MARKMTDVVTFSRSITPATQFEVFGEIKAKYLNNGWEVLTSHFLGITGPELMMAYTLVRYEDELLVAEEGVASRKRGRPAKVLEVQEA